MHREPSWIVGASLWMHREPSGILGASLWGGQGRFRQNPAFTSSHLRFGLFERKKFTEDFSFFPSRSEIKDGQLKGLTYWHMTESEWERVVPWCWWQAPASTRAASAGRVCRPGLRRSVPFWGRTTLLLSSTTPSRWTYNPTGHPVRSQDQLGIHPQSPLFPCAFTGMYLQPHWHPVLLQAQSGIQPQSHWSLCGSHWLYRDPPILPRGSLCLNRDLLIQEPIANLFWTHTHLSFPAWQTSNLSVLFTSSFSVFCLRQMLAPTPHGPCPITDS